MNGITQICILLAISCLVYIAVEYKPSGVMRDVGFSFIGFTLGALSLLGGAKFGTMLLVLFLPICDSIWVFINRVLIMKKNPMKGDYTHLHHRLMKIGFSRPEIRVSVWIFTLTMLLLLVLLGNGSIDKMVLFVRLAAVFFGLHIYLYWIKKIPFELIKKDKKQTD
jgi:UDP-GlcNAc:undecaprenyl-phosphate GlcNAc-1-phosphate transferase